MKYGKLAAAAGLMLALAASHSMGQIQKGKTRPLETKVWMKAVNQNHCGALAKQLKEGITDDKGWADAAMHAQMLSESGHVLMADGRCPDKVWADAAKQLREASEATLASVTAKNLDKARTDFQNVLASCKGCHSVHRKK
jgi:cytochrome c556